MEVVSLLIVFFGLLKIITIQLLQVDFLVFVVFKFMIKVCFFDLDEVI